MVVKMRSIAIAAAVISGFAASQNLFAACTCTNGDRLSSLRGSLGQRDQRAGQIQAGRRAVQHHYLRLRVQDADKTGSDYAAYSPLDLKGTVTSGLTGTTDDN
jgi:hypothetical protein